jgi:uncharacterized repeat protein (TIGR03803 family)
MMIATALALALAASSGAEAHDRFHTLYTFHGLDGAGPTAAPIVDKDGNIYGTTEGGGPAARGAVYKLTPDGNETLLADFARPRSGYRPMSAVWRDGGGNLFGTTFQTAPRGRSDSDGTVFEITKDGRTKVLYRFTKDGDAGYFPEGGVIADGAGNLYGTTSYGGKGGAGTVFRLARDGTMTVFHSFHYKHGDAGRPNGSLTMDLSGNLYGTATLGGAWGGGVVFKVAPGGTLSFVYSFAAYRGDGITPSGGVTLDAAGDLYGVTSQGGYWGYGSVFKIAPDGTETQLYGGFQATPHGASPNGPVVLDSRGNLYGTTVEDQIGECGTVFELSARGEFRLLHVFDLNGHRIHNGCEPMAGLAIDAAGNLYGTTSFAGGNHRNMAYGTLFKVDAQ